jgi:hypothetical protein
MTELTDISKTNIPNYIVKNINSWTAGEGDFKFIQNCLNKWNPKTIVEIGCGLSTVFFAYYAAREMATLESIENHPESIANTLKTISELWLNERVNINKRELKTMKYHDREFHSYDLPVIMSPIDFLFIDGPLGCHGREASLYLFENQITDTTKIFIHDFGRPGEQEAIKNWMDGPLKGWKSIEFHNNDDFPNRLGMKVFYK